MGWKMGDVFAEESFKFGEILGPGEGENRGIFSRRIPLFWGEFGGIEGENGVPCAEEIPPERARTGAVLEGENGENGYKKGLQQRIATALLGGHYSKDIIRVLNQTASKDVSVFFKTNTLSKIFVLLSAQW